MLLEPTLNGKKGEYWTKENVDRISISTKASENPTEGLDSSMVLQHCHELG